MRFIANIFWNYQQFRLRAGWRLFLQSLLLAILLIAMSFGFLAIEPLIPQTWMQQLDPNGYFGLMLQLPAILISVWLAGRLYDRRRWADFGFHFSRSWWKNFAFGLFLGAFLMILIFLIELGAGWVHVNRFFSPRENAPFLVGWLIQLIIFICVGIYEETLTRGYQLRNLAEGLNFRWVGPRAALILACLMSSILFGFAHLSNPNASLTSTIMVGIAGIFLSLGYLLTGELAIPIGLHIAWNFFQGCVFGFPVSGTDAGASVISINQSGPVWVTGGAFGPEAGVIGLFAITVGCILIFAWVRWQTHGVHWATQLAIYTPFNKSMKPDTKSAEPGAIHPESLDKPE